MLSDFLSYSFSSFCSLLYTIVVIYFFLYMHIIKLKVRKKKYDRLKKHTFIDQ